MRANRFYCLSQYVYPDPLLLRLVDIVDLQYSILTYLHRFGLSSPEITASLDPSNSDIQVGRTDMLLKVPSHIRAVVLLRQQTRIPLRLITTSPITLRNSASMTTESQPVPKRTFPPLYKKFGDVNVDRLAFFHILERLKTQKRTGWTFHKISDPESISDHMYRMAMLALCSSDAKLDIAKCVMLCIVHDLAEAQVGDIAPHEGIPKAEKRRLEEEAMYNFVHDMLHYSPAAQRIEALWKEYEDQHTEEAKFVKDLDRFEMALQASDYEQRDGTERLQDFFNNSIPFIKHPEVQSWGRDLEKERSGRQSNSLPQ